MTHREPWRVSTKNGLDSLSFAYLDTRVLIHSALIGSVVSLTGMILLVPEIPILGAAIALTLGFGVTAVVIGNRMRRDFGVALPWARLTYATLLSIPLSGVLLLFQRLWPNPSAFESAIAVGIAGAVMLVAQWLLARDWLPTGGPDITAGGAAGLATDGSNGIG